MLSPIQPLGAPVIGGSLCPRTMRRLWMAPLAHDRADLCPRSAPVRSALLNDWPCLVGGEGPGVDPVQLGV